LTLHTKVITGTESETNSIEIGSDGHDIDTI
jgi:hypothetical protein